MLLILGLSVVMVWGVFISAALFPGRKYDKVEPTETSVVQTEPDDIRMINVLLQDEANVIPLRDYLVGVLLSELPSSFHLEAKKAQAVAARTFVLRMEEYGSRHGECAVCDDPGCCQGYLTAEAYLARGGTAEAVELARKAVDETQRLVIMHNDVLIEATYFSCSGGRTEDAVAVWGTDIPYLQSVESPGEEEALFYNNSIRFSKEEFQKGLGVELQGEPKEWFGATTYSEGGGVATMEIGGKVYSGNELRKKLQLRSTWLHILPMEDCLIITTHGFGHRVGLSQYGANAMAEKGYTYDQILKHYYLGIEIVEGE